MSKYLNFKKNVMAFIKKPGNKSKNPKSEAFKYNFFWQNWIVFKLLARLFFNDRIAVFITIIIPFFISIVYLVLYKTNVVGEHLFSYQGMAGITNIKKWFEFTIYTVGFVAFIYLAVSIADIKQTILFKKIISGFTTKGALLLLFFIFYLLLTLFGLGAKIALFMFYPSFRNIIVKKTQWGYMIGGLIMFVFTNLSLGLLFSSFKMGSKGVFPLTLVGFFGLLLIAGLWIGPTDIESLFFAKKGAASLEYSEIKQSAKIWRYITLISPFQPGMKIMVASLSTQINRFDGILMTNKPQEFFKFPIDFFGDEVIKTAASPEDAVFNSLENFKQTIVTPKGLVKWNETVKKILPNGLNNLTGQIELLTEKFATALKEKRVLMESAGSKSYIFTIIRSGFYQNYSTPFLINTGWIVVINSATLFLWTKTNQF